MYAPAVPMAVAPRATASWTAWSAFAPRGQGRHAEHLVAGPDVRDAVADRVDHTRGVEPGPACGASTSATYTTPAGPYSEN